MVTGIKGKTLLEMVRDEFNQKADELICEFESIPIEDPTRKLVREIKVTMLNWAKKNLEGIILKHQLAGDD